MMADSTTDKRKIQDIPVLLDGLKAMPLCAEMTQEQCKAFSEKVRVLELKKKANLIREGSIDHTLYMVLTGRLDVKKKTANNDWITLKVLNRGDMVGQSGFIDGTPHTANVVALENSKVFALDRKDLEFFLTEDPDLVYKVMRAIVRSIHQIIKYMNQMHVEMNNYISHSHGRY